MKNKEQYAQELSNLMVDLNEAIKNKNEEKVNEITEMARLIINDLEEVDF